MFVADALIDSQIMGVLAIKFNQLSRGSRAPRGRVD